MAIMRSRKLSPGLAVTQIKDLKPELDLNNIKTELVNHLAQLLGYSPEALTYAENTNKREV